MGLFQFSKRTFDSLNKRWKVLELKHKHSREDFLFDINTNIYLGARFFGKELLPRYRGDLALSLMDFGSGYPAVKDWVGKWSKVGKEGDFEYMMETARHRQTADLVRSVFATMSIVQAADIFRQ
jgi:soluble lytic murein transglycosylase-like protein